LPSFVPQGNYNIHVAQIAKRRTSVPSDSIASHAPDIMNSYISPCIGSAEVDILKSLCVNTRVLELLGSVCVYRDSVAITCTVVFEHINIEGSPVTL